MICTKVKSCVDWFELWENEWFEQINLFSWIAFKLKSQLIALPNARLGTSDSEKLLGVPTMNLKKSW